MRHFLFVLLLVFSINPLQAEVITVGKTAPDFSLMNAEGEEVQYYTETENKVSVILFWATWCPYCANLMPHLEVVYRKYRNKGLKFYAVSVFEDGKLDPVEYFQHKKYSYELLLNGDEVADLYGVKGTPGVLVVDKNKQVVYRRPSGVSELMVKQNMDLKIKKALSQ